MIESRLIVCIANSWDYDPTSKHHIMRILSQRNEVLWINYRGSRRPEASTRDVKEALAALRSVGRGVRKATASISQMTPLVIPGATNRWLRRAHRRMVIAQLRRAVRAVNADAARPVQVWSFAPDVDFLVGALGEERFLYYCVDEYRHFEGFNGAGIERAERAQLQRADVVVASSSSLLRAKRRVRPDAALVRHGVDYDHFASAWRTSLEPPDDLAGISGPVLGFFGLIHHWVDLGFLARVARLRPHYAFVLLGECKVDAAVVGGLSNVHLLGRRPYDALPAYAAGFDAGLMLFRRTAMTRHVNPVKMYEYLAAGLPIVSTPLPEANRFAGVVTVADSPERFARACDDAVERGRGDRERISRIVRNETWASKVEYLSDLVMGRAGRVVRSASKPSVEVAVRTPRRRLVAEAVATQGP